MKVNRTTRWIAIAAVVLFVPWSGAAGTGPADARQELHLLAGTFDPLLDPIPPGFAVGRLPGPGPYIVQFAYPMGGGEAGAVEAAGGTVAAYLPDGAFAVVALPTFPARARAIEGVRWVGALPAWARMAEGTDTADRIQMSFAGPGDALLARVATTGLRPLALGNGVAVLEAPPGAARAAASLDFVLWVEPYREPSPLNYRAVLTDRLRTPTNGSTYSLADGALWTYDPGASGFLGYTGAGYAVDVTDRGIDGTHPALAGRMDAYRSWTGGSDWVDTQGHGTHVAATALGSGAYLPGDAALADGTFAGAAPGAQLIGQKYNASALNYTGMAEFAAASGATVSVNSWGDAAPATQSNYTAASATYDMLTADAFPASGLQPLLFVFAAGNEGQAAASILPPATAKNVLTVGGTGNDQAGGTASSDIASFSSFGPTDDGRIKPDLVAPGERIASANSTQDAGSGLLPRPPLGGASYVYLSGTSQAAPQVAGASVVAAQYLQDVKGIDAAPALLKAVLINGATPLAGYPWPGPAQGWGRMDVRESLLDYAGHRVEFVGDGSYTFYSTIDVYQYDVEVEPGADLRVTLVWTDAAGTPLASKALVNDLDLEVRDPTESRIFPGNTINTTTAYSIAGPGGDHTNNVEVVRVKDAEAGVWKIVVRPYNLPAGAQSFALVVSGAIRTYETVLVVDPLQASIWVAPGANATLDVRFTVVGTASASEEVMLSGSVQWMNASNWSISSTVVHLPPSGTVTASLNISNDDRGMAGFRGAVRVTGTFVATGATFDFDVNVTLTAFECLESPSISNLTLPGNDVVDVPFSVTNCGNTPLSVTVETPNARGVLVVPADPVPIDAGQAVDMGVHLQAGRPYPDVTLVVTLTARSGSATTSQTFAVHRATGVQLNGSAIPATMHLSSEQGPLSIRLTNDGDGGYVQVPLISGVPPGWTVAISAQEEIVLSGGELVLELLVEREADSDLEADLVLTFYAGSAREGELAVNLTVVSTPPRPPTAAWPTDVAPGLALLAGLGAAAAASAIAARPRGIPRTCPACGQEGPRFDTFMNPSCPGCGAVLAPKGGRR